MTENFLKFKRKLHTFRILKSVASGVAPGGLFGGIFLILSKRAVLPFSPFIAFLIGLGVALLSGGAIYLALRVSDKRLAEDLDERFALHEKVQTMVAYQGEEGDMLDLQRQDAEKTLSTIPLSEFKPKYIWVYLVALCIGVTSLASGLIVKDARSMPKKETPFKITAMQIAALEELIRYVDDSDMATPYRGDLSSHLTDLLTDLKTVNTEPEMRLALTEAMAYIQATTYDSSSSTELLNALWDTGDESVQTLAKTLDTSEWTQPDWGDYAEKMSAYREWFAYTAEENEEGEGEAPPPTNEELLSDLRWKMENTALKIDIALIGSGIAPTDPLYMLLNLFSSAKIGSLSGEYLFGLGAIAKDPSISTYEMANMVLSDTFADVTEELYDVISQLKINTNVGEYVMTKLSTLFLVPSPAFERPDFSKKTGNGNAGTEDKEDENGPSDGGIGEGAVYGSNDLVLDPLTGEYVEYGVLLDKYYAITYEKLENGDYTETQKEIIKNYFALLYSGIEKEDGN